MQPGVPFRVGLTRATGMLVAAVVRSRVLPVRMADFPELVRGFTTCDSGTAR